MLGGGCRCLSDGVGGDLACHQRCQEPTAIVIELRVSDKLQKQ